MKKTFTFFFILLVFTDFAMSQSGWFQQFSLTGYNFRGIHIFNSNTVCVCGYNNNSSIILKTTNSGNNWNTISNIANFRSNAIYFQNELSGWACGEETNLYEAAIFRTTNGGNNWSLQVHSGLLWFTDIAFNSLTDGWCIGWAGMAYWTTNAGNNWIEHSGLGSEANNIFFLNSNLGWIAGGGESGNIVRTTNGGINWIFDVHQWIGYNSVHFSDSLHGWAVGYYNDPSRGIVSRTTNGGINWISNFISAFDNVLSVYFVDSLKGWIADDLYNGGVEISVSYNGGLSWESQTSAIGFINRIKFINNLTGWAIGNSIYKTITGGITTLIPISSEIPSKFSLSQNYPNPFNPNSKIKFQIAKISEVRLVVYDILGKEMQSLVNEQLKPGVYETEFNGSNLASGLYFFQLTADDFSETKKMILIK